PLLTASLRGLGVMDKAPRAGRVRDRVLGRTGRADVSIYYTAEVKGAPAPRLRRGGLTNEGGPRLFRNPPTAVMGRILETPPMSSPSRGLFALNALLLAVLAPVQQPGDQERFTTALPSVALVITPGRTATAAVIDADRRLLVTSLSAVGSRDAVEVVFGRDDLDARLDEARRGPASPWPIFPRWTPRGASAPAAATPSEERSRADEMEATTARGAVCFPRRVAELLRAGLDLRDRHAAGEISRHGLAVVRGRLENQLSDLI